MRTRLIVLSLMVLSFIVSPLAASAFTLSSGDPEQHGWNQKPLVLHVNRTNCPADFDTHLNRAIALWNSAPESSLKLEIGADTSDTVAEARTNTATDVPLVACDANFPATFSVNGDNIPGVGFVSGATFQPIEGGALVLNVEAGRDGDITTLDDTTVDVVVAHEIGHMLGIGHSSDTRSLMYFNASYKQELSLSQDDRDAVSFLYPRNELGIFKTIGGCGAVIAAHSQASDDDFTGGNSLGLLTAAYALCLMAAAVVRRLRATQKS